MGLFDWLRRRRAREEGPAAAPSLGSGHERAPRAADVDAGDPDWVEVTPFVDLPEGRERTRVALVATAIAAGDRPSSSFAVRRVARENPEFRRVAVIAAAVAAGERPSTALTCTRVLRHDARIGEESHAAQVQD